MGSTTYGQICFGVLFPEDYEFPWDSFEGAGGIDEWWRSHVCGYSPPFQVFDREGNYIDGEEPPQEVIDEYYQHRRDFDEEHPLPFQVVNCSWVDDPRWVIAVPESCLSAEWGSPTEFKPENLAYPALESSARKLTEFCKEHCQPWREWNNGAPNFTPKWYLSGYRG